MIASEVLCKTLKAENINFYCGVPDSLLKDFCAYITDNTSKDEHIITANEGNAIALAAGYYLATKNIGLVYMQNSGLGNAVNPLTSLTDSEVYSIPVLLMIGWRGEPGVSDEPQHKKMGKITEQLLNTLGIPYEILPNEIEAAKNTIRKASKWMKKNNAPFAIIVKKDTFEKYSSPKKNAKKFTQSREDALKKLIPLLNKKDIIVSTTGKASREIYEFRGMHQDEHDQDFLTVGSMGHASNIALGLALKRSEREVYCIDGDGSVIMHMGAIAILGSEAPSNFKHIIINNGSHESVGAQPTVGFNIDFRTIAKSCGYKEVLIAEKTDEIEEKIKLMQKAKGPSLLEIRVNSTSRKDLGRPTTTPIQNKDKFMKFIKEY